MTAIAPTWQCGDVSLYLGDCQEILPTLGKVDAVVTDPPYGMQHDPDYSRVSGGQSDKIKRRGSDRVAPFTKQIHGDDAPFDPSQILSLELPTIMWGSNHYAQRLPVGTTLVWIKKDSHLFGTFLSDCEIGWMRGGCGAYVFHRNWNGFARLGPRCAVGRAEHPNEKPIELLGWCIHKVGDAGTILDPFMGSGTTGVAAVKLGRKFIGIEIEPKYFEIAVRRISEAQDQFALFEPVPEAKQTTLAFTEDAPCSAPAQ